MDRGKECSFDLLAFPELGNVYMAGRRTCPTNPIPERPLTFLSFSVRENARETSRLLLLLSSSFYDRDVFFLSRWEFPW